MGETKLDHDDILDEWLKIVRTLADSDYATLDEKLFTFILYGLNRGQLHLFWKSISSQGKFFSKNFKNVFLEKLVSKWYTNSSFVKSPGKNQITCLLIPLSRLPFYFQGQYSQFENFEKFRKKMKNGILEADRSVTCMNNSLSEIDLELSTNIEELVMKHHLFSWQL